MNTELEISGTSIRIDDNGLYCLNDLHKASKLDNHKKPSKWLNTKSAKELCFELDSSPNSGYLKTIANVGTFACKELVYAYAMWLSPKFMLIVIRAYDAMVMSGQLPNPKIWAKNPQTLKLTAGIASSKQANELFKAGESLGELEWQPVIKDCGWWRVLNHDRWVQRRKQAYPANPETVNNLRLALNHGQTDMFYLIG